LAAFEEYRPDLILLDFELPDINGLEVLTYIRTRKGQSHVPVILVSAHSDREHHLRGIKAGADDFLDKPVDAALLLGRVRTLVELKQSRDVLQASRDALEQRHNALQEAQREHRELTEFIVHDLKSPLAIVQSGLEWARAHALPSQVALHEVIADACLAAGRISTMVSDLLTISSMEQSDFLLRREPLSVPAFLDPIIHSYSRRADERGIMLSPPPLAELEVQADRTLLQRVMENILDNAFRYTPAQGRIAISVRPWNGIQITVSNDGPPIPPPDRRRIFEKFRRGADDAPGPGNAGIGLYFCKRAIEAHGGAIDVVETRDWPTSFLINLP
jgi:signal transduction histidine kinase